MNRILQFAFVLVAATGIAAIGSHLVAGWLKIKTTAAEPYTIGKPNGNPPAYLAASSIGGYGISWDLISTQLDLEIKTWGVAGGSCYEFEQFQKQVPEARTTFIVVSTIDLDEADVCDFHANIVPIGQTIKTLMACQMDWQYSERALSQYPTTLLRALFPTLGRSRGLMGEALIKVKDLIKPSSPKSETLAGPVINFEDKIADDPYTRLKMSDCSESQIMGKVVAMLASFHGRDSFNGPKHFAFLRMLQYGCQRGQTVVIVMPLSVSYSRGIMSPDLDHDFEASLADAQHRYPKVEWARLDQVPGLDSDSNFCDLVHMNVSGKRLATEALQAWLDQPAHQP